MKNSILIFSMLMMVNCQKDKVVNAEVKPSLKNDSTLAVAKDSTGITLEENLKNRNDEVLASLKSKNYTRFSEFIHPEKGVLFSMYSYIDPKNGKHFSKADFEKYISTNIKFTWGEQDGTGNPLILPISKYLEEWAFSKDFTTGQYFQDEFKGSGNSINNIQKKYPNLHFTENYIAGTEEYGDMNWGSLIFVFEDFNGTYYLVAVINNSWTT